MLLEDVPMRKSLNAIILVMAIFAIAPFAVSQIKTAKVTGGEVQGVVVDGIAMFKGIPFAAPPVGELRWKAPQPVKPWTGIRKADTFGPGCMQDPVMAKQYGEKTGLSEDCLFLDVWTPAKNPAEKLAVIVWIYGGGFSGGLTSTPMYDGTGMAKKGVIQVSVAYRVGPFGFLAHPELSSESGHGSGNYGLEDMIAGLKWVQENVARFGGDPSRVTIFGHSAGAHAVSMLAASPAAKGLFRRAICMSGGSFAPLRTSNEAGMSVPILKLAEETGANFLKKLGAADIKAARALTAEQIQKSVASGLSSGFRPVGDGYIIQGDQYLLYQAGRFNDIPVLLGSTSDEAATFGQSRTTAAEFEKQIKSEYGSQAEAILKAYPHATDAEATRSSKGIRRETSFAWHTWSWARLQSQKGKGKAYLYIFDKHAATSPDGAGHGSDVPYVFQTLAPGARGEQPQKEDLALSDRMNSYWVNFAKTGNPNSPGLPPWPAFAESAPQAMVFDAVPSARPLPNIDKLKAFDSYYSWRRDQASGK
jgi:para-nitrobenzyl esterase